VPTTHILKPAIAGFDDHDLNEHLCLAAAQRVGLRSAPSRVLSFGAERAVVVERYDRRIAASGAVIRVHQEDMCQAMGVPPDTKYQAEGGPSPEQIIALLRDAVAPPAAAEAEVARFADALVFNWLIAGTDAHAKNYSVLHENAPSADRRSRRARAGRVRVGRGDGRGPLAGIGFAGSAGRGRRGARAALPPRAGVLLTW